MPYFSHFNNAIADLEKQVSISPYSGFGTLEMLDGVRRSLIESEKFYLPNDIHFTHSEEYIDTIKEKIRLPFEKTAILYRLKNAPGLTIILAEQFDVERLNFFSMYKSGAGNWIVVPQMTSCDLSSEHSGATLRTIEFREDGSTFGVTDQVNLNGRYGAFAFIVNLCVMLSLHNVKATRVTAPKLLKRIHKKKNFYDYHVLNVNGDIWDNSAKDDDGREKNPHYFRSHMRRGHIRNLPTGKNVWVSSCFVRGNLEGYVGKEYQIAR